MVSNHGIGRTKSVAQSKISDEDLPEEFDSLTIGDDKFSAAKSEIN